MNKSYFKYLLTSVALTMPAIAFAATNQTLKDLVRVIISYLNVALVLMMALAIVMFTYYVIKYFVMPNPEGRKEGNMYVMYSVIGFFVILSFWGLVNIVQNTFGLSNTSNTPGSWASFSNIFPGGGGSSSSGSNIDPGGELNLP